MPDPCLVDANTLQHFAAVGRMDILRVLLEPFDGPYWTDAVREEIWAGAHLEHCAIVLEQTFLGVPTEVTDLAGVAALRVALAKPGEGATAHLGEAESIHLAASLNGHVVTDDRAAHDFAARMLGEARVHDSVDLLRRGVHRGVLNGSDAQQVADGIRNVGRHLRSVHPDTFVAKDFE